MVPSHVPPHTEPSSIEGVRLPTGSPLTGEQTPTRPNRLQAAHCAVQVVLQQYPSTHDFPALQSAAVSQLPGSGP